MPPRLLFFLPDLYIIDRSIAGNGKPEHTLSWMGDSLRLEAADRPAVDFGG